MRWALIVNEIGGTSELKILADMSLQAKIVLGGACAISVGTIGYVHFKQEVDRRKLHDGVIRDVERQQRRKMENTYALQQQIDLTKKIKKELSSEEKIQSQ